MAESPACGSESADQSITELNGIVGPSWVEIQCFGSNYAAKQCCPSKRAGDAGDTDPSNNTTTVVIDVDDKQDAP